MSKQPDDVTCCQGCRKPPTQEQIDHGFLRVVSGPWLCNQCQRKGRRLFLDPLKELQAIASGGHREAGRA